MLELIFILFVPNSELLGGNSKLTTPPIPGEYTKTSGEDLLLHFLYLKIRIEFFLGSFVRIK